MANKKLITIEALIIIAALVAGWFYINGSDQSTKNAALIYFFGALIVYIGLWIFKGGKK